MNCQSLIANLGFSCRDLGGDTMRVWSPFSHWRDGERIGLYIEKSQSGYRITDACESMMHVTSLGAIVTSRRMNAVRQASGFGASILDSGEISTMVSEENLGQGIASVLNASLAVTHFGDQWLPRVRSESFTNSVRLVLEERLGERVLNAQTVTGASGHQIELPIAVRSGAELIYVQPIAADDDTKVDWKGVYANWGRMMDLKRANIDATERLVVIEDAANDAAMKGAIELLTESASVIVFSKLPIWADKRRA